MTVARTDGDLAQRVASFPQWHYEIDLGHGIKTPIFDQGHINRHAQRVRYFFEPLTSLCGGTLAGKRVLDLGCNAGFWTLKALEAGAAFVHAIDGRAMHIEQTSLVLEAREVDQSRFQLEQANVFSWDTDEQFDVVLCLGLLYHVARPVELLERCARWNSDLLVVDTHLSYLPGSALQIHRERVSEPRNTIETEMVMHPTHKAVLDMYGSVGYREAVALRPRFSSWVGSRDFQVGARRAFVGSTRTPLRGLDEERLNAVSVLRNAAVLPTFAFGRSAQRRLASVMR